MPNMHKETDLDNWIAWIETEMAKDMEGIEFGIDDMDDFIGGGCKGKVLMHLLSSRLRYFHC